MKSPTGKQATAKEEIVLEDGRKGYCCWYPQMGGYSGIAIVIPAGDCFDVLVWHDGEFPFDDDPFDGGDKQEPVELHHCCAEQFVRFGNEMKEFKARSSNG